MNERSENTEPRTLAGRLNARAQEAFTHDEATPSLTADPGPAEAELRRDALAEAVRARFAGGEPPENTAQRAEAFVAFLEGRGDTYNEADKQVKLLAEFIVENIPGEPSQSEGAVECAIRLLERAYLPLEADSRVTGFDPETWGEPLEELLERSTTNITESDDDRELEYRVRHGDSELELYARGYIATDAALAIKLALSHDDE